MPTILGSIWSRLRPENDPYDDFFLNAAPADPRNLVVNRIREAPDGSVFAVKAETHTPEVKASHIKELGRFFGVDLVYIARSTDAGVETDLPYAVLCLFRAEHDSRDSKGIGGRAADLAGAFATFQIAAIIREFGFQARRAPGLDADPAAAKAGLGTLDGKGRLVNSQLGARVHVADLILTDLPVAPD